MTGSVTRKIGEPRSSQDTGGHLRFRFSSKELVTGAARRRLLEFSRTNRSEGRGSKRLDEERGRRKTEGASAGVDSGFRQEGLTVNPRPLASDEPTLSLAHGLYSLLNTRALFHVCPFRAVPRVRVRRLLSGTRERTGTPSSN